MLLKSHSQYQPFKICEDLANLKLSTTNWSRQVKFKQRQVQNRKPATTASFLPCTLTEFKKH